MAQTGYSIKAVDFQIQPSYIMIQKPTILEIPWLKSILRH